MNWETVPDDALISHTYLGSSRKTDRSHWRKPVILNRFLLEDYFDKTEASQIIG